MICEVCESERMTSCYEASVWVQRDCLHLGYRREKADRFRLFLALRAVLQTDNGSCVYCGTVGGGHDEDCPVPEAHAALHAAGRVTGDAAQPPPDSEVESLRTSRDQMGAALRELLRLYDWRFVLAEREKDPRYATDKAFNVETNRLLRQYGAEKKAAWAAARLALAGDALKAPKDREPPLTQPGPGDRADKEGDGEEQTDPNDPLGIWGGKGAP